MAKSMTATNHDGHSNDGHNHDGTKSKPKQTSTANDIYLPVYLISPGRTASFAFSRNVGETPKNEYTAPAEANIAVRAVYAVRAVRCFVTSLVSGQFFLTLPWDRSVPRRAAW